MKLSITTSSFGGYGLNRVFEFTKEVGFDGIEIVMDKKEYDTTSAEYLSELSAKHNLPIIAIQAYKNSKAKQIQEAVELAITIGTKIIVVNPPKIFDLKYTKWLKEEVPKIREKEEISIALENAADETILGFIPAHALASLHDLKRFKHACFNTANAAGKKENIIDALLKIQKYMVHVHLTNTQKGKDGTLPHKGSLPIESFIAKLKQEDYKGTISVDVNPKYLHVGNDDEMKKSLQEIVAFCRKYM